MALQHIHPHTCTLDNSNSDLSPDTTMEEALIPLDQKLNGTPWAIEYVNKYDQLMLSTKE